MLKRALLSTFSRCFKSPFFLENRVSYKHFVMTEMNESPTLNYAELLLLLDPKPLADVDPTQLQITL